MKKLFYSLIILGMIGLGGCASDTFTPNTPSDKSGEKASVKPQEPNAEESGETTAIDAADARITFVTTIPERAGYFPGSDKLGVVIMAAKEDQDKVWIDLNDNGKLDENLGEKVTKFGFGKEYSSLEEVKQARKEGKYIETTLSYYKPTTNKVTIYGNVTEFRAVHSHITEIDVTKAPNLRVLDLGNNELTKINIANNPKLDTIWLEHNRLSVLDLSNHPYLKAIDVSGNPISKLELGIQPNLTEISAYETSLVYLGFVAPKLKTLDLHETLLTTLDLSKTADMTFLRIDDSNVQVDLTELPKLEELWMDNNKSTKPDFTGNPNLEFLRADSLGLTTIDLSKNRNLRTLFAVGNLLETIDLSHNPKLEKLEAAGNVITHLDLKAQKEIFRVDLKGNKLDAEALNSIYADIRSVRGIFVDDSWAPVKRILEVAENSGTEKADYRTAARKGWYVMLTKVDWMPRPGKSLAPWRFIPEDDLEYYRLPFMERIK